MTNKEMIVFVIACTLYALFLFWGYQWIKELPYGVKHLYKPLFAIGYVFTWLAIAAAAAPIIKFFFATRLRTEMYAVPFIFSIAFYYVAHGLSTPEWIDRVFMAWGGASAVLAAVCMAQSFWNAWERIKAFRNER